MSYAASDTDVIAAETGAEADENAAEVEVSTDDSADDSDTVSDEEPAVPTDAGEQPETTGDDTEVESTEGEEPEAEAAREPELTLETEVVEPDKATAGSALDVNFDYATDEVTNIIVKKGAALEEVAENAKELIATNATAGSNGEVYPAEVYQYTATPAPGYQITSIKAYNNADRPTEPGKDWADVTEIKASTLEGEEGSKVQTLTIGTDFNVADYETITIVVTGEKIKYNVTVTLPTNNSVSKLEYTECDAGNTDFTAVDKWTEWTTGAIQAEHGNALGFKITPAAGFKVTGVSNTSYIDTDGVYVTGAITEEAAFVVSTEATEQPAETVTLTLKDYTDKATNKFEVFPLTKVAGKNEYTKADTAVTSTWTAEKGKDAYFILEADAGYKVTVKSEAGTKKTAHGTSNVKISGTDGYTKAYKISKVSADTQITVALTVDTSAYSAFFDSVEDDNYRITTSGNATTGLTDARVADKSVYTTLENITYTITPDTGYEVIKVEKVVEGSDNVRETDSDSDDRTFTFNGTFNENAKKVTYEVTVAAIALTADGGKITFTQDASVKGLTLNVKEVADKFVKDTSATDKEVYLVKNGAQYVEFTLTAANTSIAPVVTLDGDVWEPEAHENDADPYQYKMSAKLFETDKEITISQIAADKTLTIVSDGAKVALDELTVTVTGEADEREYFESGDFDEDNAVDGLTTYRKYTIPSGSEVTITVAAQEDYKIASYKIGSGEAQPVDDKNATIKRTLTDHTTVVITPAAADPAPYDILLKNVSSDERVEAVDGVYSVNYNQPYTVSLMQKDAFQVLYKADLKLEGGKECATKLPALNGTDSDLRFTIDANDAGKTLLLKLWDTEDAKNDDTIEPCAALTLKVSNAITKATITGVKNKKLTQTVDTKQSYEIKVEPKDADVNNLAADIKWAEGVTAEDKAALTAAVEDGKLVITVPTAKDAAAADALNAAAQKATIRLADKTKGTITNGNYPDDAIIEGSDFVLAIEAPKALTGLTPTVKLKSSDDVSLTLTLGVPASAKLPELNAGKLWYEVKVSPQGAAEELTANGIKPEETYYFAKEAGATQDKEITVSTKKFGEGIPCDFKVNVKVVQTLDKTFDLNDKTQENYETGKAAALTDFASKAATELTAATKTPYYATKLTLKKATTNVYTGMEGIKIATLNFGKEATFTGEVTFEDITSGVIKIPKAAFHADGTDVTITLNNTIGLTTNHSGYYNITPGKHTIRISAKAPDDTVAAYADLAITLNRGIEKLELNYASDKIYKESNNNKAASLKGTPVYNDGYTKNNYEAKTKKVKDYVLVKAEYDADSDEYHYARTTDSEGNPKDVILENTKTLSINAKNGAITVAKDFDLDAAKKAGTDKFFVRATSADWTDKASGTSSSVYGYSELITITGDKMELGDIVVVTAEENGEGTIYRPILSEGKKIATSGEFVKWRNDEQVYNAWVSVLKKNVTPREDGNGDYYLATDFVESEYLTYKSSNAKTMTIVPDGLDARVTSVKTGKNLTLTVTANDGSKAKAELKGLEIKNQTPTELGLMVEEVHYNYDENGRYNSWTDDLNRNAYADDTTPIGFTGTANSVLKLTVMRHENNEWFPMDELSDLKVTVSGAKTLNKVSQYNQEYTVVANTKTAKVKLVYTGAAGKVTKEYIINNTGINTTAAPKLKTTDKLQGGIYDGSQTITYTLSGNYDYKGKVVRLETDAADRSNSKKAEGYQYLEMALLNGEWTSVSENGKFELNFNNDGWDAFRENEGGTYIPAGSYKMIFTFGKLDANGRVIPDTKPVNVTLKANAPKKVKSSYKPVTTVKMSVYDTAAGVELKGTGKDINTDEEYYGPLKNANITGQKNHFTQLFELTDNVLKLKSSFTDELKADLLKTGEIAKATVAEVTNADVVKYITESTSKAAKNDRIGYVDYQVEGVSDPSTGDYAYFEGTTKLTVTFNNKKSTDTYTLTNTTVLQGTDTATVQVLRNKKFAGDIADAYVTECSNSGVFKVKAIKGQDWQADDIISFTLGDTTKNTANKYKVTVYIVPKNNYYQGTIQKLKEALEAAERTNAGNPSDANKKAVDDAENAYKEAITAHGIKVTTTITVGDKGKTKNKISVAKNNLKPAFTNSYVGSMAEVNIESDYDAKHGNYYIHIPYTTNLGEDVCGIAYIESNDGKYVAPEGANAEQLARKNLLEFGRGIQDWDPSRDDYGQKFIDVSLTAKDLANAVKAKKVKYSEGKKKATISATATIHFTSETEKDESGNDKLDKFDKPQYVDEAEKTADGKEVYQTETIKFTITLPEAPKASGYDDALNKVKAAKADIEKAAVPTDWIWNGEGLDAAAWTPDENGKIILRSDNDDLKESFKIVELINNVGEAVEKVVPRDTGVEVRMPQKEWNDERETITLAAADFTAPTTTTEGTLKVQADLYDATTFDDEGNIIPVDSGDIKASTKETIEFTVTIPALKEKPSDVEGILDKFVKEKAADADYIAELNKLAAEDEGMARNKFEKEARIAAGLVDADGAAVNTLRLNLEKWDYQEASVGVEGYIKGCIHVFGYRYGGEGIWADFNFTTPALKKLSDTADDVKTAVDAIQVTNKTTKDKILETANAAIMNPMYEAVWQKAGDDTMKDSHVTTGEQPLVKDDANEVFKKVAATRAGAGYIIGTIVIRVKDGADSEETPVTKDFDLTITQLASNENAKKAIKAAVGFDDEGTAVDTAKLKDLILKYENDKAKVKAGILTEANKVVANDGYTVTYKKDTADTPADIFDFTPAKYKATAAAEGTPADSGEGSIYFTLEITDTEKDADDTTANEEVSMATAADPQKFGPFSELQTLEQAEADVTAALTAYKATITDSTAVDADAIKGALTTANAVTGTGLDVKVENFSKKDASVKEAGSITCDVVITKTVDEEVVDTKTVEFAMVIEKVEQNLAAAKTAAESVLNGLAADYITNDSIGTQTVPGEGGADDTTKDVVNEDVLNAIKGAVEAVVDTTKFTVTFSEEAADYTVQKATIKLAGSVKITVVVTEKETTTNTEKATRTWTIAALDQSPEEAETAAQDAIDAYIATTYADGIEDTAAADLDTTVVNAIKAAIEAVVKTGVYTVDATKDTANDNKIFTKDETDAENPVYKAEFTLTYTDEDSQSQTIKLTATIKVKAAADPNAVTPANSVSANDSTR
ncbi:MAG: hypothetical protein NC318_10345 [Blautia sp.]|nr:hypothetical protein [Blautia sp.]MCM1218352.1 hypothetical protein [Lachnospiraceae bacterium]